MLNDGFELDLNFLDDIKFDTDTESKPLLPNLSSSFVTTTKTFNQNIDFNFNNNNTSQNITYNDELINLTKRVENYNKVVLKLKKIKAENVELEKNLQSLNQSANEVRIFYKQEIEKAHKLEIENSILLKNLEKVQLELNNASEELVRKKFNYEQSKAELENDLSDYKEKVLPKQYKLYNNLGLKYVQMGRKLQEYNLLESVDKVDIQRVINYLKEQNVTVKSLKRSPSRKKGKLSNEFFTQTENSFSGNFKSEIKSEITSEIKSEIKCKEMKTQATQYISSSTTRSTCTSTFIKKHNVGTNFPEIIPISIEDILQEMTSDLPRISPIQDLILDENVKSLSHIEYDANLNNGILLMNYEVTQSINSNNSGKILEFTDDCLELLNNENILPSLPNSQQNNSTSNNLDDFKKFDNCNENIKEVELNISDEKPRKIENITKTVPITAAPLTKDYSLTIENMFLREEKCKKNWKDAETLKSNKLISLEKTPDLINIPEIQPNLMLPQIKTKIIDQKKCDKRKKASVPKNNALQRKKNNLPTKIEKALNISLKNQRDYSHQTDSQNENQNKETCITDDNKIVDEKLISPGIVIIDNIKIVSPIRSIISDRNISPEKMLDHLVTKSGEYSIEGKSLSFEDIKLQEFFELSSSDIKELECNLESSLECNDFNVKDLFLINSISTNEVVCNNNQDPNSEEIDEISNTKNKDCLKSQLNITIEESKAERLNDLLCKKINALKFSDKSSLDRRIALKFDKTDHCEYTTKLRTLKEIKSILQESPSNENIKNLLNGELSKSKYSLASLWSLMGETIFKLSDQNIENQNSNQIQLELLNERIQMLSKQIEKEKKNEQPKKDLESNKKIINILDADIDSRNSDVISPISDLSSISLFNTETQHSAESLAESEKYSPIFLEKVSRKQFNCDLYEEKISNRKLVKSREIKQIRNKSKTISKRKKTCSSLQNKIDAIFSAEMYLGIKMSCRNQLSAVDELLKKFPVHRKRHRKCNVFTNECENIDKLNTDKTKIDCQQVKLEENFVSTDLTEFKKESVKETKIQFCQNQVSEILQNQLLNETSEKSNKDSYSNGENVNQFLNENCEETSKDGENVMESNEIDFYNFVEQIIDEFCPSVKMSPILELSNLYGNDAIINNSPNNFLIQNNQSLEINSSDKHTASIFEDMELDFNSPESPPQFYQETNSFNPIEIPFNAYNDDSPASPAMQLDDECKEPIIIPGKRFINDTLNGNMSKCKSIIAKFDNQKYKSIRQKAFDALAAHQPTLIKKLCGVLNHFVKSEGNATEVQKCVFRLVKRSKVTKLICKAIVQVVENIINDSDIQNTPPCPNMTLTHQKLICLCDYLGKHIKQFFSTLVEVINSQLFSLKKSKKAEYKTLINLTQLYIGVMDLISTNRSPARLFMCKCLYYYNAMAIPLMYQIIIAYPAILPHREDPEYDHTDPIITTLQCVLNSLPYNMSKIDLRHPEIFHILKLFYGYERIVPSKEDVIENFIAKLRAGKLRNLSYSFAIICKQNGIEWTERYVISKNLLPLINEYFNEIKTTDKNDNIISALLEILSFIIKPFPAKFQIDKYQHIFSNFLYATDRKTIQQSAVDINETQLQMYAQVAKPLLCEYLKRRPLPLKIDILKGSIDTPDEYLENCDAVVAIEIIEHLYPDVLENIPHNIFGFIKPKLAIFTTPNSDANILFNLRRGEFRHDDHKFEWSRLQFREWCINICKRYPNYVVSITGIGRGPPEFKKYGKTSQIAIFIRKDIINLDYKKDDNEIVTTRKEYKLVFSQDYPFERDDRTHEEKIYDESIYYINQYKDIKKYVNYETNLITIPLNIIFALVDLFTTNKEEFTTILKNKQEIGNYKIENENIILEVEHFIRDYDDVSDLLCDLSDCDLDVGGDNFENPQANADETAAAVSDASETWD